MAAPTSQDVYDVLKSIDARLATLNAHFGAGVRPAGSQASAGPTVASDGELDSQYGNPEVKAKDPRDWTGDSMKGRRFSECPPSYLDLVADRLVYFAEQAEEHMVDQQTPETERADLKKKAHYNRKDAARARGWAARLRNGWTPPAASEAFGAPESGEPINADEIPF